MRGSEFDRFRTVTIADTEYQAVGANPIIPVCLVTSESRSGKTTRMFFDQPGAVNPLPVGRDDLFIAYHAAAELGTFLRLGWELPSNIIDLYYEHLKFINGHLGREHTGLLDALQVHGIDAMAHEAKDEERDYIIAHGVTPPPGVTRDEHQRRILDYCHGDVRATEELFRAMLPDINLEQALLRGSYAKAVAHFEANGIPVDAARYREIERHKNELKVEIARATEAANHYGVYTVKTDKQGEHPVFSHVAFDRMIDEAGIEGWPRTPSGSYKTDKDTLKEMCQLHPALEPLRQAKGTLEMLAKFGTSIGDDSHNRYPVFPFGTATGRNAPKAAANLLLRPNWVRGMIRADQGYALVAVDVVAAETGVAAAMSDDENMRTTYYSNDIYLSFAISAGAAPQGATKKTHPEIRALYKTAYLGINYMMTGKGLASRIGKKEWEADVILGQHRKVYKQYWAWLEAERDAAFARGYIETAFGWRMAVQKHSNPRAVANFHLQAGCGEILRIACCLLVELGYGPYLVAPLHDAIYCHAPLEMAEEIKNAVSDCFVEAGHIVLGSRITLRLDAKIVPHPDSLLEEKGQPVWDIVTAFLDRRAVAEVAA